MRKIILGATMASAIAYAMSAGVAYGDELFIEEDEPFIEEIVVEGEFRKTQLNQLAGSVSVLRPDEGAVLANHLDEILGRAANVNFAAGASRGRYIQIRGVGERGQFIEPLNPSIGLVVDGVDLSGIGTAATMFDVAQVEVFRGPQGTLYGANALAGLINVVTPAPDSTLTTAVQFDAGDYGALGAGVVVSGPLAEGAGFRISAHQYSDDGFIENDHLHEDDTNARDERTLRAKFIWGGQVTNWRLSLGQVDVDNGYDAFSLDNTRHTLSDQPGLDTQDTRYASLAADFRIWDRATLQASVGYVESDIEYGYDEDWAFVGFDPAGYSSRDLYARDVETLTAEARLVSNPAQGLWNGTLDWVLGVYSLTQDVGLQRTYSFLVDDFVSDFSVDRVALYAEVARVLANSLKLTVGARAERHESQYSDSFAVGFSPDDDLFGGRILLEKATASNGLLYGAISRGYKTGGFNADGSLDSDLREFGDEALWNLEVGYKAELIGEAMSLNVAVFRMQREDVQISTSIERMRAGGSVEFIEYIGNAAEGYNQGVEVGLSWRAVDNLTLFAEVGLLDTEFSDYTAVGGSNLDGRSQAHAPNYQFYTGGEYLFGDGWFARVEVEGKDEFYFSNSHDQMSDSYALVNATVGYETTKWSIRLWGRNLSDEDYFVRGFYFGNDPRDLYQPNLWTQLGAPRQIGVSLQANF